MKNIAIVAAALLFLAPVMHAQTKPSGPPPLLLGSAWYPEQWPESRWEADLTLMQQAHLHVVRVGEFAWSTLEPSEGHYRPRLAGARHQSCRQARNLYGAGHADGNTACMADAEVSRDAAHRRERPSRRARQSRCSTTGRARSIASSRGSSCEDSRSASGTILM